MSAYRERVVASASATVPVQIDGGPRAVRLRALPPRRFRELVNAHRDDATAAATAVLQAALVDEAWTELDPKLSDEDFQALAEAAWDLNRGNGDA